MSLKPESSVDASLLTEQVSCVLTHSDLDTQRIIASVQDGAAGATAVFIGTTRNSFKGSHAQCSISHMRSALKPHYR